MAKQPKRKPRPAEEPEREERIMMEIVVDAYTEEERAMGWYYYLEDQLHFPFTAHCIQKRAISPLRVKDEAEVISMAPESDCECEVFVMIRWEDKDGLGVPLSQLEPIKATAKETKEAVADWHYWVRMGYQF